MSTIAKNEFEKSLARLEGMAKSQLFHTPNDSDPREWAGSKLYEDEDENHDGIDENGTDYEGVKKSLARKVAMSKALTPAEVAIVKGHNPMKLIGEKIAKGGTLTKAETWAIKGGRKLFKSDGMANSPKKDGAAEENKDARDVPDQNVADKADGKILPDAAKGFGKDDGDDDEDDKKPWEKSLAGAARTQPNLSKGIEMSPILHEFVVAIGHALEGQESRVVKSLAKSLAPIIARLDSVEKSFADQGEFNKSLAEAVVGIGQHVSGTADVAGAASGLPTGAPKSQLRSVSGGQQGQLNTINKSFNGPGGLESGELAMAKSQVVDAMYEMVKAQKLNPLELVKFESTGQLNPQVQQAVLAFAQGGGR